MDQVSYCGTFSFLIVEYLMFIVHFIPLFFIPFIATIAVEMANELAGSKRNGSHQKLVLTSK